MSTRTIYILDSDPSAALVTQRGLQALLGDSVSVTVAPSADAAWLACANNNVDLMIVDPGVHGNRSSTLLKAVRAYRPQIPVVILTAYDTPGLRQRMRDLGVDAYLAKPAEIRDLVSTVRSMLIVQPQGLAATA